MPIDDVPSLANPMAVPRRRKRSWSSALENLSIGLGHGMANNLQGIYELGTDPYAGTQMLEGLYQMGSRPVESAKALGSYAANALTSPLGAGMFLGEMVDPGSIRNLLRRHPMMQEMTAYHGSPHKFDKFELSDRTIGTGEGAQAYGHGLYFAEDPKVAGQYAEKLSVSSKWPMSGYENMARSNPELLKRIEAAIGDSDTANLNRAIIKPSEFKKIDASLKKEINQFKKSHSGSLYHVDIPDEQIAKMLDWDAPLSEQPEAVRKAIERLPHYDRTMTGGAFYEALSRELRSQGGAAYVSRRMRELGIPGIRYLDGTSRKAGEGTRNFVVFDDSILKILNRE